MNAAGLREALEALEDENDGWLEVHGSWDFSAVALNKHAYVAADAARTIALPILEADPELVERIRKVLDWKLRYALAETYTAEGIEKAVASLTKDLLAAISTPTPWGQE